MATMRFVFLPPPSLSRGWELLQLEWARLFLDTFLPPPSPSFTPPSPSFSPPILPSSPMLLNVGCLLSRQKYHGEKKALKEKIRDLQAELDMTM